ncbi:MAG: carboxymuconolactone decarboxylase family protein [Candidatus Fonsibacter sp.]
MNQINPITIGGDWVASIKESIPDHSKDIKLNIDAVINRSGLDLIDSHACALAAAIASGNGELAFEIQMNGPLMGAEEREAAKTAASLMGQNNIWYPFVEMAGDEGMKGLPAGLRMNAYATHGGVSKKKFEMYSLAASIVGKCHFCVKAHYDTLKKEGMTTQELMSVGRIASVVTALSKVAL